jgi:uncharacterized BrkB/YihY/UPF0761 family membrane protein
MPRRPALRTRVRKVVELWIELFDEHGLLTHASAIAFQVLKSLIPLSLLGIALLGEVGRRDIWAKHLAPAIRPRFDPPVFRAIDFAATKICLSLFATRPARLQSLWQTTVGGRDG